MAHLSQVWGVGEEDRCVIRVLSWITSQVFIWNKRCEVRSEWSGRLAGFFRKPFLSSFLFLPSLHSFFLFDFFPSITEKSWPQEEINFFSVPIFHYFISFYCLFRKEPIKNNGGEQEEADYPPIIHLIFFDGEGFAIRQEVEKEPSCHFPRIWGGIQRPKAPCSRWSGPQSQDRLILSQFRPQTRHS